MICGEKKKAFLRAVSLLLSGLLLLGTLAACNDGVKDGDYDTSMTTDTTPAPEESEYVPTAITEDFGGYEFRVLTRGSGMWTSGDIIGDAVGNTIDQAVYLRNEVVTKAYNFVIKETKDPKWTDTAKKIGDAGEDTYDMWSFRMNDMPSYGQEGYIYNLNEVKGLNLDAQYYDQSTREMGSFNNYLFFVTGDLLYLDDMSTNIIEFNRDIYNQLKLEDIYGKSIYQLVRDHEWTLETFERYCKAATFDSSGDGKMTPADDMWGFSYQNADILAFNIAFGNRLLDKNSDDIFVLNESSKMIDDLQEIMRFFNAGYSAGTGDWTQGRFTYGNQLFASTWVNDLPAITAEGINFGVAPMPMANSTQESYNAFITTYGSNCITLATTLTGDKLDKAANIIELLSYESSKRVTPKLTEYLLGGRIVNEPEDAEMLEIGMSSKTYELCYLWSTGALYSTMTSVNDAGGEGVASALASCRDAVEASVQRKLDRLNKLG